MRVNLNTSFSTEYRVQELKLCAFLWAENFRIEDIEVNAWYPLFVNLKLNQSEWCMQNPKQLIRSREILNFAHHFKRTPIGRNPVVLFKKREKERIRQKSEVQKNRISPTCMVLATWAGFINLFISPIVFAVEPIASESLTLAPIALAELLAAWT